MFHQDRINALPIHRSTAGSAPAPLEGMRIVDFTHFIAGPLATMCLGDFGASVIKVEAPSVGEDFRHYPTVDAQMPAQGSAFLWANRNKQSIAIDLKSNAGLEVVKELITKADILVENFSSGVMDRFGLDYETCARLNPRLIYCSISAYGRDGPFADRLGFDPVVQAESGFISMNGYPDRQGVRSGAAVMDVSTAMTATNAILLALLARHRDGLGQRIDVALYDTAILMTGFGAMQHLTTGYEPQRNGNTSPDTCPSGVFQASDTPFYINCGNDKIFQRLFSQVLNKPEIANDPFFANRENRLSNREHLFSVMENAFILQPWAHWSALLRAANVPHGQVKTLAQALASPESRARDVVTRIPHPVKGWIPNIKNPIHLSRTPAVAPVAAPAVGANTQRVLSQDLAYSATRIAELYAAGAFGDNSMVKQ